MRLDWIVAITLFLFFVSWSFIYYTEFFTEKSEPLTNVATMVSDKIVGFLQTDVYRVPVRFNSSNTTINSVLYLDFIWPDGTKNSTRMFSGDDQLLCNISDNTMYWLSNLTQGENYFLMKFAESNTTMNCNASISTQHISKTVPWVQEKKTLISQLKIDEMLNTDYNSFRDSLDINQNFRVELEINESTTTYGLNPPLLSDIRVEETNSMIWENNQKIKIRVLVW
jgi:hypothetical protein